MAKVIMGINMQRNKAIILFNCSFRVGAIEGRWVELYARERELSRRTQRGLARMRFREQYENSLFGVVCVDWFVFVGYSVTRHSQSAEYASE